MTLTFCEFAVLFTVKSYLKIFWCYGYVMQRAEIGKTINCRLTDREPILAESEEKQGRYSSKFLFVLIFISPRLIGKGIPHS